MKQVAILGVGQTPVRDNWNMGVHQLAVQAGRAALVDADVERPGVIYVGNMTADGLNEQTHLGTKVADHLGLWGVEAMRIEAACGSAGSAMRQGVLAVASGMVDSALVIGVEKMLDTKGKETTAAMSTAADNDYEVVHGISFVALNALVMQRYMHEYGYTRDDFAPFPINAHANGAKNPNALFRKPISKKVYDNARMISDPVSLFDASPVCDGAAAVLLVAADKAPDAVKVAGSAIATDTLAVHDRPDPVWLTAGEKSAAAAYAQAGMTPDDIDLFELHDAFSIMAALSLEACGFAERGRGVRLGQDGSILPSGRIPICSMGGLKARGHPVGATGLYQIVEATLQLRGEADEAQLDGIKTALTQNIGGSGATIAAHILTINS